MARASSRVEPNMCRSSTLPAARLQKFRVVPSHIRPHLLGRIVVTPFITIGVLAAVLVWEVEHVGSIVLGLVLTGSAIAVAAFVARKLRRDIDQLAAHYEALLAMADEQSRRAEAANHLKDEFLATLSHELRTRLNAVLGWSRLLASGKLDANQAAHAVQAIERAGWAQSRLVEDLLDVSRIVSGRLQLNLKRTLVQPLIEDAVNSLRSAGDAKRIVIDVALDPAIGPMSADPDRLQQVVWNLVSNAIKFTPAGGRVDVTLDGEDGNVRLAVRDTGIGFTPNVAQHLFQRFRQGDSSTTREYGGLGLGLGIVRYVIELHGGTVRATS